MAKMKKLILKCEIEVAQKRHFCKHSKKHIISKGDKRLTLILNDGRATAVNYCQECGLKMIEQAQIELKELETKLKQ